MTERPALGVRAGFGSSRGSVQQELLLPALLLQPLLQPLRLLLPPCPAASRRLELQHGAEIGRAPCRARVSISVVAVSLKKEG